MSDSSLRQRRSSEGGAPRFSEDDGSGARARRKSDTAAASPRPSLSSGARLSSQCAPRTSFTGQLRSIADGYVLTDEALPQAQHAATELLRCRFQAVLAAKMVSIDLVRHPYARACGSLGA